MFLKSLFISVFSLLSLYMHYSFSLTTQEIVTTPEQLLQKLTEEVEHAVVSLLSACCSNPEYVLIGKKGNQD
jgi:hypothetical protein